MPFRVVSSWEFRELLDVKSESCERLLQFNLRCSVVWRLNRSSNSMHFSYSCRNSTHCFKRFNLSLISEDQLRRKEKFSRLEQTKSFWRGCTRKPHFRFRFRMDGNCSSLAPSLYLFSFETRRDWIGHKWSKALGVLWVVLSLLLTQCTLRFTPS